LIERDNGSPGLMPEKRPLAVTFTVSSVAGATPTFAHHPGGNTGGAGPIFTIPASTLDEGQLAVGIRFDYVRLTTLSDATLINAAVTGNEGVHDL
jgi:hypothetical protein